MSKIDGVTHILIVDALTRSVCVSTWFDDAVPRKDRTDREKWLLRETREDWPAALITEQVLVVAAKRDEIAVYRGVEDLLIFATGRGAFDEFALLEIVSVVAALVRELCPKGRLCEAVVMDPAVLPKLCVALDGDLINDGQLEITDPALILRFGKLKPVELLST